MLIYLPWRTHLALELCIHGIVCGVELLNRNHSGCILWAVPHTHNTCGCRKTGRVG